MCRLLTPIKQVAAGSGACRPGLTALGGRFGPGIAGLSTLSATSFIAVSAMVHGGFAGGGRCRHTPHNNWRIPR
ncbi:hypothetical protein CKO44_17395 [Rubrivivax gelatinosus]|uniref:Uncharacterized protein n=1 Tax=Rubrivivax gelatinosus TaxID=28068 RepID=A0ABS1E3E2_RUBGE|nr:hypothetical protein [Rubrivivax gelatinosus]MBK1715921.1 hypothetical protein [Rubrivivax gelatinosus]